MPDLEPRVTRVEQIAADLRDQITTGRLPPGARLPTDAALRHHYRVSRSTVRLAVGLLLAEQLTVAVPHVGVYVAETRPVPVDLDAYRAGHAVPDAGPWEAACQAAGIPGRMDLISVTETAATPELAVRLETVEGAPLVLRIRHAIADDAPAQIQHAWYPAAMCAGTPVAGPGKVVGGVFAALRAAGLHPVTSTETIGVRPATDDERLTLRLTPGAGVLEHWRAVRLEDSRVVEARRVVDAGRVRLVYRDMPIS